MSTAIRKREIQLFVNVRDDVLIECRKFPQPMWELGSIFVRHALRSKRSLAARPTVSA